MALFGRKQSYDNWFNPDIITKWKPTNDQLAAVNAFAKNNGLGDMANNKYFMNTLGNYLDNGSSFDDALNSTLKDMPKQPTSKLGALEKGLGVTNQIIGGLSSLTNIGLGIYGAVKSGEMLEQAKKQFEFEKGLINRNIENQGKLINEQVASRANLAGIYGSTKGSGYSGAKQNYKTTNSVNTAPIG